MSRFVHVNPAPDAHWRAVVLFGRNSATYKFALGEALLALAAEGHSEVALEELAVPYARALCRHLRDADRQGTASGSQFLSACRRHARGELAFDAVVETTRQLGFANVLNAFHRVGSNEVGVRFFDPRGHGGLVLTDALLELANSAHGPNLAAEVEARWRLVETAWNVGVGVPLLRVEPDARSEWLVVRVRGGARVDVASARDALSGYQRGACFYCYQPIRVVAGAAQPGDIDHVYPIVLASLLPDLNLNGVWNLVLACRGCNRGVGGNFDRLPHLDYLERLARRNDDLVQMRVGSRGAIVERRAPFNPLPSHGDAEFGCPLRARTAAAPWRVPRCAAASRSGACRSAGIACRAGCAPRLARSRVPR
ncbi:MAG: HNH endonuclease [Gemmatirosa sp.]